MMKLYWILYTGIFLIGLYVPCEGLFGSLPFQDFVDKFVDIDRFKEIGLKSLNSTAWENIWAFFKTRFNRHYSSSGEENQRISIFREHLKTVIESNLLKSRTFQLELNQFADWTVDEFNSLKKGLAIPESLRRRIADDESLEESEESVRRSLNKLYQDHYHSRRLKRNLYRRRQQDRRFFTDWFWNFFNHDNSSSGTSGNSTDAFDWRTKNVVSGIKNQLKCGSCYAFATAQVMESIYAIKTKATEVTKFSPQQFVDCSSGGNNGCSGGNFRPSVNYLAGKGNKIATEASYPYVASKQACKTSGITEINLGTIQSGAITQGDEKQLAAAIVKYGPVFIGLDADSSLFMFYKTGVLNIKSCPNRPADMDHALVVVGYGYDKTLKVPYWIIKNSYGTEWGESGYLRLAKDAGNMCGITSMAYYATLN